jgi:ATPases involved in chromosome partitioning
MMDQADKLRQLIGGLKAPQTEENYNSNGIHTTQTRVITVTSGKGGVGKTNVTVNLGVSLSHLGYRVIIIDVDFGLANIDLVFGITPTYTLADVINNSKNIQEVLTEGPAGIKFISGGSGVEDLVNLDSSKLENFIKNISLLDSLCDIILIDTGAGLSESVMSFVMASDEVLVVATPEPTSITDAYALVKMLANRDKTKKVSILINRAENEKEAKEVLNKLCTVSKRFLGLEVIQLGYVQRDDAVIKAVKLQNPFILSFPESKASATMINVAKNIISKNEESNEAIDAGIKKFVNRLAGLLSGLRK